MEADQAKKLREPFPREAIGYLPKGGSQLPYVGHAAVTDRLLQVDPGWTWKPLATDEYGLPAMDAAGNLWIQLTVCGVTRLGVGDGATQKIRIGDALRNAAMRFGVALDLWAKEDLHAAQEAQQAEAPAAPQRPRPQLPDPGRQRPPPDPTLTGDPITPRQLTALHTAFSSRGITDREDRLAFVIRIINRDIDSSKDLTKTEAGMVLDELATGQGDEPPEDQSEPGGTDPWQT